MTTTQAEEIERMWAEGMSGKQIANALGIPKETVYSYAKKHRTRCRRRWHKVTDDAVAEMRTLHCDGVTQEDIAACMGYSLTTVRKVTGKRRK